MASSRPDVSLVSQNLQAYQLLEQSVSTFLFVSCASKTSVRSLALVAIHEVQYCRFCTYVAAAFLVFSEKYH